MIFLGGIEMENSQKRLEIRNFSYYHANMKYVIFHIGMIRMFLISEVFADFESWNHGSDF